MAAIEFSSVVRRSLQCQDAACQLKIGQACKEDVALIPMKQEWEEYQGSTHRHEKCCRQHGAQASQCRCRRLYKLEEPMGQSERQEASSLKQQSATIRTTAYLLHLPLLQSRGTRLCLQARPADVAPSADPVRARTLVSIGPGEKSKPTEETVLFLFLFLL